MRQLLSDLRVVDLTDEPAGAYAAKAFADVGADVVKVEPPGGGALRSRREALLHLDTNKRAVVVDGATDAGRARLAGLLDRAHVVIESPGYGDLARYGVDRDELRARRPSLVVSSVTAFGAVGPYAGYRWSDLIAQTAAFLTQPQGPSANSVPVKLPAMVGMAAFGQTVAAGSLAAALRALATGEGAHVDCAAYEALGAVPSRVGRFLGWEYRGRTRADDINLTSSTTLIPSGVFPCADGFVSLMSTPQQMNEMIEVLDDDNLREVFKSPDAFIRPDTREHIDAALYPWLLSRTRLEATAAAQAAGWPFAHVNSPAEVLEADHMHQRGFWAEVEQGNGRLLLAGAPYRHAEGGWRLHRTSPAVGQHDADIDAELSAAEPLPAVASRRAASTAAPLDGIRVLDLTTVWSGPYITQLLGDLGAEVIRVENPSVFPPTTKGYVPRPAPGVDLGGLGNMYAEGVPTRPDRPYNRHAMNNSLARNKLSCTLDPRRPEARELFMRLVDQSDVFIENLKTSTLHSMGLHESQLMDRNPRMIVLRCPAAGLTGDWSAYTGFGAQFDGLSSLAYLTGHHDKEMAETPATTYMDVATGPAGAFAVMAALHYREATGRGQIIELAQLENVLAQLGDVFVETQLIGEPHCMGNRDPRQAPQGVYACSGDRRWLAITVADDEMWRSLSRVIGRPELADDPRYADVAGRYEHHDDLDRVLSEWAAGQDVMDAFYALQAAGVAAGPQLPDEMIADDPNTIAREWIRPLTTTDVGTHLHLGHAFRGIPQVWHRGSPSLGEDNEYVYKKVLGVDDDEYQRLIEARVVTSDYLDSSGNFV